MQIRITITQQIQTVTNTETKTTQILLFIHVLHKVNIHRRKK